MLRPNQVTGTVAWPTARVWPLSLTFQLPADATAASLLFEQHRVPLDLPAALPPARGHRDPSAVPTPAIVFDAPTGTSGYYLGSEHGLAVKGASRIANRNIPGWDTVTLDLVAMSFQENLSFAPLLRVTTDSQTVCLRAESGDECVRVRWGDNEEFEAALQVDHPGGDVPWPRRLGWPLSATFDVPSNVETAVLAFGEHRIPLDLLGMTGGAPRYDHKLHYDVIAAGSTQYDLHGKRVTLTQVEDNRDTGATVLRFSAVNSSATTDFTSFVSAAVARVSVDGTILDGLENPEVGWLPVSLHIRGDTLAPGQSGGFSLSLPRVGGQGFKLLTIDTEVPDVALVGLTVSDEEAVGQGTVEIGSGLVAFTRGPGERRFWLPDLVVTGIVWDPVVPSAGHDVSVVVTVENGHLIAIAGASELVLLAGEEEVARTDIDAIEPGQLAIHAFTWRARVGPKTFVATVDPETAVEESDEINNRLAVDFGGAFVPDLVVEGFGWSPTSPSVGDEITLSVGLRNIGKGFARDATAHVFLDSEAEPSWVLSFGDIQGEEAATSTVVWTAKAGSHIFRVVADGPRTLAEINETNNEKQFSYKSTLLADLFIDTLVWTPAVPMQGGTVTFTLAVRNQGAGKAGALRVSVFLDQESSAKWNLRFGNGIDAGDIVTSSFQWTATQGAHTFRAVADAASEVPESNEANNEGTSLMSCVAPCP